jgi:hypothetical protein
MANPVGNFFRKFGAGMSKALTVFKQSFRESGDPTTEAFDTWEARQLRYEMGFAFYESTQYDELKTFVKTYKFNKGLYEYIADFYNPTAKLVDFYKAMIWAGVINLNAENKGAIPIVVGDRAKAKEKELRAAIAHTIQISNLAVNKNILILHGTTLGDACIYIRDDAAHQECRMEIIHPSQIKEVEVDGRGFVKSYTLEEYRTFEGHQVTYKETAEHSENGDDIIFRTYKDNELFTWEGNIDSEWTAPYGFIPLILIQHINEGRIFGKAEIQNFQDRISRINDQASILADKTRQHLNPFLLANFAEDSSDLEFTKKEPTETNPQPNREKLNILYVDDPDAGITPVFVPIDIAAVTANILQMWNNLKDDLPELRDDIYSNLAEETIRAARARVESKVIERRTNYDSGLVRGIQMTIAIGGARKYPGYGPFDLSSYKNGLLDFSIGERPVFAETATEKMNKKTTMWTTASQVYLQTQGTIPFETVLRSLGATDDDLKGMPNDLMNQIKAQQEDKIPTVTL